MKTKPKGYWSKSKCHEKALKYNSKISFLKNDSVAYNTSVKKGWLDEICTHMTKLIKHEGYWDNIEVCRNEALKYDNRKEFHDKSSSAYKYSTKNGWLDEICSHMKPKIKPNGYWSIKENVLNASSQCNTKSQFKTKFSGAYVSARKNGWLEEAYQHMEIIGDLYKRLVYVFEFSDGYFYVGLTGNFDRRLNEHLKTDVNSTVLKHIKKTNLTPKYKLLSEYIEVGDAAKLEIETIDYYLKSGFKILNKHRGGGLGRKRKI